MIDIDEIGYTVYATTDDARHAAAICGRRMDATGEDCTYQRVCDLRQNSFPIRSSYMYAVIEPSDAYRNV